MPDTIVNGPVINYGKGSYETGGGGGQVKFIHTESGGWIQPC